MYVTMIDKVSTFTLSDVAQIFPIGDGWYNVMFTDYTEEKYCGEIVNIILEGF